MGVCFCGYLDLQNGTRRESSRKGDTVQMLFGRDAHTPLDELAPALDDTDFGQGLERTPHGSPRSCRARLRRHPPDQYVHRATRSFCFDNMSPSSRIALLGCKSLLQKG
ncbi:unnamed protein product, partial [Pylaiella littoralis]